MTPREVAESYWRAECERDVEKVLEHYHADAVFCPPGQRLVGHEQIRTFYEESVARFPGLEVEIVGEVRDDDRAALEWSACLIHPDGTRHHALGVNVVEIDGDRFRSVRAYFNPTDFG